MKDRVIKYDLWLCVSMCPEEYKSDSIKELEKKLNDSMGMGYNVYIDDRE